MMSKEAHRGCALVQDGVRWVVEEQPRHRDALPLAAGQRLIPVLHLPPPVAPGAPRIFCCQALSVLLLLSTFISLVLSVRMITKIKNVLFQYGDLLIICVSKL